MIWEPSCAKDYPERHVLASMFNMSWFQEKSIPFNSNDNKQTRAGSNYQVKYAKPGTLHKLSHLTNPTLPS